MVTHAWNPSTREDEARGSQVRGQPELNSKTLKNKTVPVLVAYTYNPSYSGGRDLGTAVRGQHGQT
jgi:hypothetical protein